MVEDILRRRREDQRAVEPEEEWGPAPASAPEPEPAEWRAGRLAAAGTAQDTGDRHLLAEQYERAVQAYTRGIESCFEGRGEDDEETARWIKLHVDLRTLPEPLIMVA